MELYEIVKTDILDRSQSCCIGKTTVITATIDKEAAEQMLFIYKQNCGDREAYEIRIIRDRELSSYEQCKSCNSFNSCVNTIRETPDVMIRCFRFGELQKYIWENTKGE